MEVVVISREMIKPSRPTPQHLGHLELSFIDQLVPPVFLPTLLFYSSSSPAAAGGPADHTTNYLKTSEKLKKSLAENLTRFYLLAGRLRQNRYVECNDEGVEYSEAHSKSQFSQVVQDSNLCELNKLVPYHGFDHAGDLPLAIQVTFFDCGGIVIGTCFNHKIADAASISAFGTSWAAAARGDFSSANVFCHGFGSAKLFPPRDIPGVTKVNVGTAEEKIVGKRFVFGASALSALKAKYSTTSIQPTRVEALSAFIWSRFVATTRGPRTNFQVFHTVNLRRVFKPPLPDSYFGNFIGKAAVLPSAESTEGESFDFLIQTRSAIRGIDGDYIKQFQEGKCNPNSSTDRESARGEKVVQFNFSSTLGIPAYEVDFGWGKPVWVTNGQLPIKNLVYFFPTRSGAGIEALFNMEENDLAKLEADQQFLAFVSPPAKIPFLSSL